MPRRKRKYKREILPDPKYHSETIAKFVNHLMERGKKSVSERVLYRALELVAEKTKKDGLEIFDLAMKNVTPVLEVKSKRIGGANYQIPIEVRTPRKMALAMRWLIGAARAAKGKPMADKLAEELMLAAKGEGEAMRKRENVQRMAEANRAFAHFA
ncbi:30S ribosomal protein S7 [bacterium (Candidatus Torokbacteria) CG09_land_8_20_14_0_10_42_11]|nr:MAG: 30S ribosomal protein S7 [bacterium (Candidatus Torokbacteria) CG09_land_8_20_14_0_10_42_11]